MNFKSPTLRCNKKNSDIIDVTSVSTGFADELAFSGSVGVCTPVPTVTTYGVQHLCRVGLCHGGVQDVLPAQSHQTSGLLL